MRELKRCTHTRAMLTSFRELWEYGRTDTYTCLPTKGCKDWDRWNRMGWDEYVASGFVCIDCNQSFYSTTTKATVTVAGVWMCEHQHCCSTTKIPLSQRNQFETYKIQYIQLLSHKARYYDSVFARNLTHFVCALTVV